MEGEYYVEIVDTRAGKNIKRFSKAEIIFWSDTWPVLEKNGFSGKWYFSSHTINKNIETKNKFLFEIYHALVPMPDIYNPKVPEK